MKVRTFAIEAAAKLLLDNQLWVDVKKLVTDIDNDKHLSSGEKHDLVLDDLKIIFSHFTNAVLNLAIALAVTWARSKS